MTGRAGFVHLVGAGPGDPGLLTVKAARLLAEADTVVHDRLVHGGVLALVRPGTRLIFVGKEGGGASVPQEETTEVLIAQARLGRRVVRLKGGDPFVFGRGGEEALALEAAGIPYEVVPGVSSVVGAPACAGIPLTHRGLASSVTIATASRAEGEPDWSHLARAETLVLLMVGSRLDAATRALIEAGRDPDDPAAVVEAGSWERQRVTSGTLATIARRARGTEVASPALLVLGPVVTLRTRLRSLTQLAGLAPEEAPQRRRRSS